MAGKLLEGIRVVDWTQFVAGPAAGCRLATLGAEVIHLEQARVGDGARGVTTVLGIPQMLASGLSAQFECWNHDKKGMTVDLSKEKGQEIVYKLVERSDVFLTNQVPNTIEKLKLDYESLSKINPRLIYAFVGMLGPKGPFRLTPGWDILGQAASGIMTTTGERGQPPMMATMGLCDHASELAIEAAILGALYYREKTGKGQWVETSQLQVGMNGLAGTILGLNLMCGGTDVVRANPMGEELNPLFTKYCCKDDRWILLGSTSEAHWATLAKVIGREELATDPRFAGIENRTENRKELYKILTQTFAQKPAQEWIKLFSGVDFPFYLVNRIFDLADDPQVKANNYVIDFEHPVIGPTRYPGMPYRFSESFEEIKEPAPQFGQHTEEVLLELGYSWEDIAMMHADEVL